MVYLDTDGDVIFHQSMEMVLHEHHIVMEHFFEQELLVNITDHLVRFQSNMCLALLFSETNI